MEYSKHTETYIRLPFSHEIGNELITFVKDSTSEKGFRRESVNIISNDVVIARNLPPISFNPTVYNEWLISLETVVENYGNKVLDILLNNKDNGSHDFVKFNKKKTLRAIELKKEHIDFYCVEKEYFEIQVPWSKEPMVAKMGDYLTDKGYSISKENMGDYKVVEDKD